MLFYRLIKSSFMIALVLAAPRLAFPASLVVSCPKSSPCPSVTSNEPTTTGSFDFLFTFVDGDLYEITGSYSVNNSFPNGTLLSFSPTVTYKGLVTYPTQRLV